MFERLGSLAYRFRFVIIVAWIVAAAAAAMVAPSLAKVGSTDQSSFLPATTESVEARTLLERAFPGEVSAGVATVSFSRASGLTTTDQAYIGDLATWITGPSAPSTLRDVVASVETPERTPSWRP